MHIVEVLEKLVTLKNIGIMHTTIQCRCTD